MTNIFYWNYRIHFQFHLSETYEAKDTWKTPEISDIVNLQIEHVANLDCSAF